MPAGVGLFGNERSGSSCVHSLLALYPQPFTDRVLRSGESAVPVRDSSSHGVAPVYGTARCEGSVCLQWLTPEHWDLRPPRW